MGWFKKLKSRFSTHGEESNSKRPTKQTDPRSYGEKASSKGSYGRNEHSAVKSYGGMTYGGKVHPAPSKSSYESSGYNKHSGHNGHSNEGYRHPAPPPNLPAAKPPQTIRGNSKTWEALIDDVGRYIDNYNDIRYQEKKALVKIDIVLLGDIIEFTDPDNPFHPKWRKPKELKTIHFVCRNSSRWSHLCPEAQLLHKAFAYCQSRGKGMPSITGDWHLPKKLEFPIQDDIYDASVKENRIMAVSRQGDFTLRRPPLSWVVCEHLDRLQYSVNKKSVNKKSGDEALWYASAKLVRMWGVRESPNKREKLINLCKDYGFSNVGTALSKLSRHGEIDKSYQDDPPHQPRRRHGKAERNHPSTSTLPRSGPPSSRVIDPYYDGSSSASTLVNSRPQSAASSYASPNNSLGRPKHNSDKVRHPPKVRTQNHEHRPQSSLSVQTQTYSRSPSKSPARGKSPGKSPQNPSNKPRKPSPVTPRTATSTHAADAAWSYSQQNPPQSSKSGSRRAPPSKIPTNTRMNEGDVSPLGAPSENPLNYVAPADYKKKYVADFEQRIKRDLSSANQMPHTSRGYDN